LTRSCHIERIVIDPDQFEIFGDGRVNSVR
jgi:hypothetical protein